MCLCPHIDYTLIKRMVEATLSIRLLRPFIRDCVLKKGFQGYIVGRYSCRRGYSETENIFM